MINLNEYEQLGYDAGKDCKGWLDNPFIDAEEDDDLIKARRWIDGMLFSRFGTKPFRAGD